MSSSRDKPHTFQHAARNANINPQKEGNISTEITYVNSANCKELYTEDIKG